MENVTTNLLERFNQWVQESIMVKLFSIGFLILVLLIPTAWIDHLIYERQSRAEEAKEEISRKWSGPQSLAGPVLIIPYKREEVIDRGKDGKEIREYVEKAYFLPENLHIEGQVDPEILHRGIFDAVVYKTTANINAHFEKPDFASLSINDDKVVWKDAYLAYGISDLRGINESPVFKSGDKSLTADPSNFIGVIVNQNDRNAGITANLDWLTAEDFSGDFKLTLDLKGSERLDFVPTGKSTTVKLNSSWNNPSFDGEFLPDSRTVSESGFEASWKVLHFNRPFAQQWTNELQQLTGANFGVNLLVPVDQYQKTMRTSKYGVLIILLTFMALFLVEITQKIRIHPFQYILIGAALTIYYTLLLSFSEHWGYNVAYLLSTLATVILISLYSFTFFKTKSLTILLFVLLLIFYGFVFIIILQQDYSLLLGSIGLFLIVGTLMYFSRKVKWYSDSIVKA